MRATITSSLGSLRVYPFVAASDWQLYFCAIERMPTSHAIVHCMSHSQGRLTGVAAAESEAFE